MGSVVIAKDDGVGIFSLFSFVSWCGIIVGYDHTSDDGFQETAAVVSILVFLVFARNINSDNMGNKKFKDGFFSVNDGISLCKFPTVDVVRVVFFYTI